MCADVVIVGGGPVGWWTAIQIKNRNPKLDVTILERDEDYKRDNKLSINRASFEDCRKVMGDELEAELFKEIALANNSAAHLNDSESLREVTHISTKDFEKILKVHGEKRGIAFKVKAVESPEEAMQLYPECSIFIAADGAHSKMRKKLLGKSEDGLKNALNGPDGEQVDSSVYKKDLLHSFDVSYRVRGQAKYMAEPTYDKIDMIVVETVGKEQDGETTVGLRFLVDEEMFKEFPEATFKKPAIFPDRVKKAERIFDAAANPEAEPVMRPARFEEREKPDYLKPEYWGNATILPDFITNPPKTSDKLYIQLPPVPEPVLEKEVLDKQLQHLEDMEKINRAPHAIYGFEKSFEKFQNLREEFTGEVPIIGSETVTKIKLSQYASKKFAVTVDNQSRRAGWFMVGDAAMGVPFYRSVNIGLKMGSQLGAIIGGNDFSTGVKAKLYNALRPMKLASEFGLVAAKLSGINTYKNVVRPTFRVLGAVGLGIVAVPLILVLGAYMAVNPKARMM